MTYSSTNTALNGQPVSWWRSTFDTSLVGLVIILQLIIIVLITQLLLAQKTLMLPSSKQNAINPSSFQVNEQKELTVRSQLLQLADQLTWDAKCSRLINDLIVSCYGEPDYIGHSGKSQKLRGFHKFDQNCPCNPNSPIRRIWRPKSSPSQALPRSILEGETT